MNEMPSAGAAAIAVNRFGLGARADEPLPADPRDWLLSQFAAYQALPPAWAEQPNSAALAAGLIAQQREIRNSDQDAKQMARKELGRETRDTYRAAVNARVSSALTTPTPFVERLVHFWANHFALSSEKLPVATLAGAFEVEAIRPHVLGKFEDMLLAVETHPAMLVYLDQARSVGPDSVAAMRAARRDPDHPRGLNENLAREIMELHTLGARSGYTQADVTEFARAMTGWSIEAMGAGQMASGSPGSFVFRPQLHEPGSRVILGRRYDQPGQEQAAAVLADFAASPATAHHLAGKLARHFAGDTPSPELVERLAAVYSRTGGDLPSVYRALVEAPQAWAPAAVKFKTPWDWTISSMRGLGWSDVGRVQCAQMLTQLGQPVWRPGSPAGYDDIAASWAAPDALVRRVELAQRFAAQVGDARDARVLGPALLGGAVSAPTELALNQADNPATALALLLVSPDFQRR
jgi:uncharacterized protein (DUF1800 family)